MDIQKNKKRRIKVWKWVDERRGRWHCSQVAAGTRQQLSSTRNICRYLAAAYPRILRSMHEELQYRVKLYAAPNEGKRRRKGTTDSSSSSFLLGARVTVFYFFLPLSSAQRPSHLCEFQQSRSTPTSH